jgi:UDP-N-acetylglucosamine 2-epimerase (non-hydrolysing)
MAARLPITKQDMPWKVLCAVGARPNFVKIAPLLRAFAGQPRLTVRLVHTGQHHDARLSGVFFEELGIPPPDVVLAVGAGSHAAQTADILRRCESVLEAEQPHALLVVGDVNSTLGCALAAAKFQRREAFACALGVRRRPLVIHVEAGLRSFDDDMPEEVNRRLTDALSDLLYVSEPAGVANLAREGVPASRVHLVGNVMIDTLRAARARAARSRILERLGVAEGEYGLLTLHRPANVDDMGALAALLHALAEVARRVRLVFPVHPRTRPALAALGRTLDPARFLACEPLGYLDFLRLEAGARVVLTDSGGVQEETTVLGVPCLTLRESTERPCTVTDGTNQLVGRAPGAILAGLERALAMKPGGRVPALWDGRAAERIAASIAGALA